MSHPDARRAPLAAGVFFCASALCVGALLLGVVAFGDAANRRRLAWPADLDVLYLPRPTVLRTLSLGHVELAADLVFLRGVVYFGGQVAQHGGLDWLDRYLETIVELDPRWKFPYRWAGVATMYNGQPITNARVLASNHFLELGVTQFPRDWELAFMLGCNYLFELHTDDESQAAAYRMLGAHYIQRAAAVGGGPVWVPLLAATILRKEGQEEAAVRHLEEIYLTTPDERTRTEIRNRLIGLRSTMDLDRADRERQAFDDAWQKTLPYAPAELFVIVGPAPNPRMDVSSLAGSE